MARTSDKEINEGSLCTERGRGVKEDCVIDVE